MITTFQATGASAGTLKCSNELSMPTTSPDSASSSTIGNISRARFTVRSASAGLSSKPGANTPMMGRASRMNSRVITPRTRQITKNRLEATRKASLRSPFSSSSVNTGTKAPWRAESANSARTRFGTWKAIVNADIAAETPKMLAATTSRTSPSTLDRPVANEKKAVLRASRRPWPRGWTACPGCLPLSSSAVANIASQEKRIHRAERERLENRRRTSQVKTWFRRLQSAVEAGDAAKADEELRALTSRIDKAAKSGGLHGNNAARKKARAARIRAGL